MDQITRSTELHLVRVFDIVFSLNLQLKITDKLSKTSDFIQSTVEALVFFQIECLKSNVKFRNNKFICNINVQWFQISETEFESVSSLGFNQNQIEILWQFIKNKEENLKTLISADNQLHFRDLEWRLEARISSRALLYQATPILTVKLHLDQEILTENREKLNDIPELSKSTQRQVLMHMDPSSLSHAIESLENALLASKTHRTRCFCKAFQSSQ